jgi:cation:H+ antiporter
VLTALEVLGALLLLVVASDAFTNAVEWIGVLFGLTRSALGSVVAAIGSSLPETMVAVVALLVLRDPTSQAVGIGAVLGAPFMLATIVFAIIGATALARRQPPDISRGKLDVEVGNTLVGLALFTLTFALIVAASFAPTLVVRTGAAALVVVTYFVYLVYHFRRPSAESDDLPSPLRFSPGRQRPLGLLVFAQLTVALAVTVAASRWFVTSVTAASAQLGIAPLVVSLFLSPIATELPEAMNVGIWMRRGQDELAFGNVIGAMMFQTSIASAIAMLASPWHLDREAYAACAAAFGAVIIVLAWTLALRRVEPAPLLACGGFYVLYAAFAWQVR